MLLRYKSLLKEKKHRGAAGQVCVPIIDKQGEKILNLISAETAPDVIDLDDGYSTFEEKFGVVERKFLQTLSDELDPGRTTWGDTTVTIWREGRLLAGLAGPR